jgi:hypothetical protein
MEGLSGLVGVLEWLRVELLHTGGRMCDGQGLELKVVVQI